MTPEISKALDIYQKTVLRAIAEGHDASWIKEEAERQINGIASFGTEAEIFAQWWETSQLHKIVGSMHLDNEGGRYCSGAWQGWLARSGKHPDDVTVYNPNPINQSDVL